MKRYTEVTRRAQYGRKGKERQTWGLLGALMLILLGAPAARAQYQFTVGVPVLAAGQPLPNAWAGGLNTAQVSNLSLNGDDVPDLLVFDRATDWPATFLAVPDGAGGYRWQYAPEYEAHLPELYAWVLARDFDGDGRRDLFTQTSPFAGGSLVRVYRNVSTGDRLAFELYREPLSTTLVSGAATDLQVFFGDLPAIADVDGDGDLDVLTYGAGGFFDYHKNVGNLTFEKRSQCWGNFEEISCTEYRFDQACGFDFERPADPVPPVPSERVMHAGTALLAYDADADGDQDLLLGDAGCDQLAFLTNGGSPQKARFVAVDTLFPQADRPARFPTFPAAFRADVNFDGQPDLIVSPNETISLQLGAAKALDPRRSVWLYSDESAAEEPPDFRFQRDDFLQSTMLDFGAFATPTFGDLDGDGDQDLLVGSAGNQHSDGFYAQLAYFENTGTAQSARFELREADYLGLSARRLSRLKPLVADLDGDGALDLLYTADAGAGTPGLFWVRNAVGAGQPVDWAASPTAIALPTGVRTWACPAVADVDGDGTPDLLIGRSNGGLRYFRQVAGGFELANQNLGGIRGRLFFNIAVADITRDGRPDLLVGGQFGAMTYYSDFLSQPADDWATPDTIRRAGTSDTLRLGSAFLSPAVADLTADGTAEVVVGTSAGGLLYLQSDGTLPPPPPPLAFNVFPNPGTDALSVSAPVTLSAFDVTGRVVAREVRLRTGESLSTRAWAAGVYFLRLRSTDGREALRRWVRMPQP